MEQLAKLEARASSLHELRELFRAMRGLAASHMQEAQSALAGVRRYAETVESALTACASAQNDRMRDSLDQRSERHDAILIAFCSEHGFVGSMNQDVLDHAAGMLGPDQSLIIVGSRGAVVAQERGLSAKAEMAMTTHLDGVAAVTRRLSRLVAVASVVDAVFVATRRNAQRSVEARRIWPTAIESFSVRKTSSPPITQLPADTLWGRLTEEYRFAQLAHATTESLVSEYSARLRAMESADRNATDKLAHLKSEENHLRQSAITSELLDIVTGSQALNKSL